MLTFVALLDRILFVGRILTEWQDFDTRKLTYTILEYLIGFGQSHMLEAHIVN
jgi:hypothetical protein